jgi:hypothetical protein
MSRMTIIRPSLMLLIALACAYPSLAQMVDCTVTVNYEAVGAANKDLLQDFENQIRSYVNDFQWGSDQLPEKIKCTMNVRIKNATGDNSYMAEVFVGSQRPILNSNKSTAVVRVYDEAWEFTYIKSRPINHNLYGFNDLASFLDFYIYLILGYDYDTYDPTSGTQWFQKASDIASLARTSSQKGWQQMMTAGYSRVQLVTDLLNPTASILRANFYRYHVNGLDSLASDRQRSVQQIRGALEQIGVGRKVMDSRNLVPKTFFDAKYLEIAEIFLNYPDPNIYVTLSKIDPYHQKTYDEYRIKK